MSAKKTIDLAKEDLEFHRNIQYSAINPIIQGPYGLSQIQALNTHQHTQLFPTEKNRSNHIFYAVGNMNVKRIIRSKLVESHFIERENLLITFLNTVFISGPYSLESIDPTLSSAEQNLILKRFSLENTSQHGSPLNRNRVNIHAVFVSGKLKLRQEMF